MMHFDFLLCNGFLHLLLKIKTKKPEFSTGMSKHLRWKNLETRNVPTTASFVNMSQKHFMLPYLALTTVFSFQTSDLTFKGEVDKFLYKNLVLQKPKHTNPKFGFPLLQGHTAKCARN
jgi:hypothetical protein